MRALLYALGVALLSSACGGERPAVPVSDAGPMDAARSDGDVEGDAGEPADGDAPRSDAGRFDGGAEDAGPPPDGGPCNYPDGAPDLCACTPLPDFCAAGGVCGMGTTCLESGCGERCEAAGAACASAADCPSGSACMDGDEGRVCARAAGGCADSRDCPAGHSCEAGTCRDRRLPCGPGAPCPYGFACQIGGGEPFCGRLMRRCDDDAVCLFGGSCVDVDGDGERECIQDGACEQRSDCGAGEVCGVLGLELIAVCGRYGPCRTAADCPSGSSCVDLWGDGITECVDPGGSCSSVVGCPSPEICATPWEGGPPRCVGAP